MLQQIRLRSFEMCEMTEAQPTCWLAGGGGGLPGPNDGHSWMWVENCANPMRIAMNRGVGGVTGKPANVQLIRIRGTGSAAFSFARKAPALWLDSLTL